MRYRPYTHGSRQWAQYHPCTCEACEDAKERSRAWNTRLPAEPLMDFIPRYNNLGQGYGSMSGIKPVLGPALERNFHRGKAAGWFSVWMADELACALGMHPSAIWGDDWYGWEE